MVRNQSSTAGQGGCDEDPLMVEFLGFLSLPGRCCAGIVKRHDDARSLVECLAQ
jgi:hypothetical protein